MTVEKIATDYTTYYIANDGRKWRDEEDCRQYEELLADPSPIKNLQFFDKDGNLIDVFSRKEIPWFCYLAITDKIQKYHWSVIKAIIGNEASDESSYQLPTSKGIWYNDWSEAYSGGYGYTGWVRTHDVNYFKRKIEECQNQIELLEKIQKAADKSK